MSQQPERHAISAQLHDWGVQHLCADSRQIQAGDAFIAWPGYGVDARQFVAQALANGATACVVEAQGLENWHFTHERVLALQSLKQEAGPLAAAFYGQPSQQLKLCAITGTNGKTSCAWFLAQAIEALPADCGLGGCGHMGTLGVGRITHLQPTGLTTPDPMTLQAQLALMLQDGCGACAIEASSIGLEEGRLDGSHIHTAVFTNFSQDHLDYHGSMDAYWQAKTRLFTWPNLQAAVINADDAKADALLALCQAQGLRTWRYSLSDSSAEVYVSALIFNAQGAQFVLHAGAHSAAMQLPLMGAYNISNVLAVVATLLSLGVAFEAAHAACASLQAVPGRMQIHSRTGWPTAVVDYAHTPDALAKALQALRPLAQAQGGKLWCIFGCGGNRDTSKRPLMAAAAQNHADAIVITSDNPRHEAPEAIVQGIVSGMSAGKAAWHTELDRRAAIASALKQAAPEDVLLIAGKGHEDYQDIAGQKLPFSDLEEIRKVTDPLMRLGQVQTWLEAAGMACRLVGDAQTAIQRLHTDTRSIQAGDLFLALKGDNFDANTMLGQAKAQGAVAAVAHGGLEAAGLHGLEVADTKLALGHIAAAWRAQFELPLIAVTGSNGKTTVTQMIASILRSHAGEAAFATQGNLNNDIGVPLTLLRLRPEHQVGVVELGMNHPGEIDYLARLVKPQVAVVNNAQREHQEFMHSVEAVAHENGSVLDHLSASGVAVFPADDAYSSVWQEKSQNHKRLLFALQGQADLTAQAEWQAGAWQVSVSSPAGQFNFALHIAGRHHVKNALAAAAAALGAGIPVAAIADGLSRFEAVAGRCRALGLSWRGRHIDLIDDSYNANPDSVNAAIDVLAELPGPHLLVLGDMGEVGEQGEAFHTEAGEYAAERGIESFYAIGDLMRYAASSFPGARHFANFDNLQAACLRDAPLFRSILIKGSRFMRLERIVAALQEEAARHEGEE